MPWDGEAVNALPTRLCTVPRRCNLSALRGDVQQGEAEGELRTAPRAVAAPCVCTEHGALPGRQSGRTSPAGCYTVLLAAPRVSTAGPEPALSIWC